MSFAGTAAIRGSWDPRTGKLTLRGNDSAANYQKALRAVKYRNASAKPHTAARTVTFLASDGAKSSKALKRKINVTAKAVKGAAAGIEAAPPTSTRNVQGAGITAPLSTAPLAGVSSAVNDAAILRMAWPIGPRAHLQGKTDRDGFLGPLSILDGDAADDVIGLQ